MMTARVRFRLLVPVAILVAVLGAACKGTPAKAPTTSRAPVATSASAQPSASASARSSPSVSPSPAGEPEQPPPVSEARLEGHYKGGKGGDLTLRPNCPKGPCTVKAHARLIGDITLRRAGSTYRAQERLQMERQGVTVIGEVRIVLEPIKADMIHKEWIATALDGEMFITVKLPPQTINGITIPGKTMHVDVDGTFKLVGAAH